MLIVVRRSVALGEITMAEFVIVGRYPTLALAQLAKATLEESGIHAFFENAELVNAEWILGNAVGSIRVLVAQADADQANSILAECLPKRIAVEEDDEEEFREDTCLACGAVFPNESQSCPKCGWSFAADGDDVSLPEAESFAPDHDSEEDASISNTGGVLTAMSRLTRPVFMFWTYWMVAGFVVMILMAIAAFLAAILGWG